jgi:hypothetical protein
MFVWYGLAGFALIMLVSWVRGADKYEDFCVGAFVAIFTILVLFLTPVEAFLRPLTWDARLHAWDLALGLDGFALARVCFRHGWMIPILAVLWTGQPLVFAINWAIERSKLWLRAAIIGGVLAVPFYMLVPACGPQHAFAGYPWHTVVPAGLIAVSRFSPRNCFPSMHFCWALLLVLNAKNGIWRAILSLYAAGLIVATVGGGEHYFVDLIAAVPFTFAVQYVAEHSSQWKWVFMLRTRGRPARPVPETEVAQP